MWAGTSSRFRDIFLFFFFSLSFCFFHVYIIIHRIVTLVPSVTFRNQRQKIYILYIHAELWPPGLLSCRLVSSRNAFFLIYRRERNLYGSLCIRPFVDRYSNRNWCFVHVHVLPLCFFGMEAQNPFSCRLCRRYRFFEEKKRKKEKSK